jgi:hypothetical protein
MKIYVYFKDFLLGHLTYKKNKFIYNTFMLGEEAFLEYAFSAPFYTLANSMDRELTELPDFLKPFEEMTKNKFFMEQANIDGTENEFQKLYKLSTLKFDNTGFTISSKMKEQNHENS